MTYLIEQLINGICQGAIYALFAIGYTIIVGVVGLVSFTFGEVIMIGAFAALFTATLTGGNILLTILFSFAASGLIGIVIHKICYEKFFESARYIPLICTKTPCRFFSAAKQKPCRRSSPWAAFKSGIIVSPMCNALLWWL